MSGPLSFQQHAAQLRHVLSQASTGIARVASAAQAIEEAYDLLEIMTQGSGMSELVDTVNQLAAVRRQINDLLTALGAVRDAVQGYLGSVEADQSRTLVTNPTTSTSMVQPRQPLSVQHWDGSYYPVAAAWAVDMLPRRVREGEQYERTVGQVMLAGIAAGHP